MTIATRLTPIALTVALTLAGGQTTTPQARQRNVIIFVADGLRHGSVNEHDTPSLWRIRTEGVHFENSYSLFPTFTTANASAIATGHGLGDTGDFSNTIWTGYPIFNSGNFALAPGTPTPFIESDQILADLHDHFDGNYLGEQTLLDLAAEHGYNTAAVGKVGPIAIQTPNSVAAVNKGFPPPSATIVVDDSTGAANGLEIPQRLLEALGVAGIPPEAPSRSNGYGATSQYNNGSPGTNTRPGALAANLVQQQWFADVATRGVLPLFESDAKPFALLFWSRDPDGTQHNQGDSLGTLFPGINGPTSRQGVQNADHALGQLLAWLDAHPAIKANTDIFVTSDHGFSTISRREIDRTGRVTASEAAKHEYVDASGAVDTPKGWLPPGFLAIDLTLGLHLNLFDPDRRDATGPSSYRRLRLTSDSWEHPNLGNGLIGGDIVTPSGSDATAIVAANGGSDLIYVPSGDVAIVRQIVALLLGGDYAGAVFVNDRFGDVPGTLPLSAIGLIGSTRLPQPAIVVAFKVFYLNPADLQTAVQMADTILQEGQGMHGGLGRDSTYNNMAAMGPDFKSRVVDAEPVSNADVAPTLASLMGFDLKPKGTLLGRVLGGALAGTTGDPATPTIRTGQLRSASANGRQTLLRYQELGGVRYIESACLVTESASACQ